MGHPSLVLASNSPRRRELLALTGLTFKVRPAEVDESRLPGELPRDYVLRLAKAKALACAALPTAEGIILAADTTVVAGEDILGKPADAADARRMLLGLRGRTHQVYTGITLFDPSSGDLVTDLCVTDVPMREYSKDEMEAYIATGDPLDKAGAYAIQHEGFHPVDGLSGCYASVMGLPLCHLTRSLERLAVKPEKDVPLECQSCLGYTCPIYRRVLRGEEVG